MTDLEGGEQLELLPALARSRARAAKEHGQPPRPATAEAAADPVARVLVDVPLAHLDRPFDYCVPASLADQAVPGARVKVRFAGRDVDGFVLERGAGSDHTGRLQPLRRVVSPEPVLTPEIAALTAQVAARYAGTRSDVLRLAVPARHATTEKAVPDPPAAFEATVDATPWSAYAGGAELVDALAAGSPRAVVTVLPGDDPFRMLAEALVATAAGGRGALCCLPDRRDVERLDAALLARLGKGGHVVLTAEAGPAKRYRAFLALTRGQVRIAVGTRAAAFAPVRDLGLVALWDDGDDLYAEPRAPYSHAREVLLMRAEQTGCAAVLAAHARSCEAEFLLRTGWASEVAAPRAVLRERVTVAVTGDSDHDLDRDPLARSARLPREAFETIRQAIERGPVLMSTPRAGYATRLACETCRAPARCERCQGPLRIGGPAQVPRCGWCATPAPAWQCTVCGGRGLRAPVLGDRRTAEEIGRAFPTVPVRTSSGEKVLANVPDKPSIVVATPGAEPVADAGYSAVLLLDTWLLLARSDLRAAEEAVRRWSNAAALVRPGGRVLLVGDPALPPLQAMVRGDVGGFARREIEERRAAHLPPASRVATLTVDPAEAEQVIGALALPPGSEVLGPVPVEDDQLRYVVRTPRPAGARLSQALVALQVHRSTRKLPHVRVQVDPLELG